MKKKKITLITMTILSAAIVFGLFYKGETAEKFFLKNYKEATEILYSDNFADNRDIIFFLDEQGNISCCVLKKGIFRYQILKISGKNSVASPGYLCGFYEDNNQQFWVDWGVVVDKNVKGVIADSEEMNIVDVNGYSYRICWIIGSGKEPQNHLEEK